MPDLNELADTWLSERGLAGELEERANLQITDCGRDDVHPTLSPSSRGIRIPYFDLDGLPIVDEGLPFARLRLLGTEEQAPGFTAPKKQPKYLQGRGTGLYAYLPPLGDWRDIALDTQCEVVITEGEAKALSLSSYGVPCIGLGGVDSFMRHGEPVAPLGEFVWKGRRVYICFDSDADTNPSVLTAESKLFTELSVRRGADVYIIRLPGADVGTHIDSGRELPKLKQGLDDFLASEKYGFNAFKHLMETAHSHSGLDRAVLEMNADVAFIDDENAIYERKSGALIKKDAFTTGSEYSRVTIFIPGKTAMICKHVAKEWLVHENGIRYSTMQFAPDGDAEYDEEGLRVLNTWRGVANVAGDVTPFLELTAHVTRNLSAELRDFPLKLMAYKLQNPGQVIPIAIVLIGSTKGTGKSMWLNALRATCGSHGRNIESATLISEFNEYVEDALFVYVDEAEGKHMKEASEKIKNYISTPKLHLNGKHRPKKQINNFAMWALSSNKNATGCFDHDDRRMFVMGLNEKSTPENYTRWGDFCDEKGDGPRMIAHYLMNYPLGDWTPPLEAPSTPEKVMASGEGLTYIGELARDMRTASYNTVMAWLITAMNWCNAGKNTSDQKMGARVDSLRAALETFPVRPFYTAREILNIFPSLVEQTTSYRGGDAKAMSAGRLSQLLRDEGIEFLRSADDDGCFDYMGKRENFLVISDTRNDFWKKRLTQEEFKNILNSYQTFGALMSANGAKT